MRYAEIRSMGPACVSRRRFLQGAAGLTAFGAAVGSGLLPAEGAPKGPPGIGLVTPLPTTLSLFGRDFHLQAPPFTGVDSDPSSVYDFMGSVGIGYISGSVTRTDRKSGESRTLPYQFNDMRFMQGQFRGRDGHFHDGTFVFTWIDVYDPSLGDPAPQIHDFNPGITQSGLFWTDIVPEEHVRVDLNAGRATIEIHDLHMKDYFDIENALVGGGARPAPAKVSFRVEFTAVGPAKEFDNAAQQFRGTFRDALAQMEWSARTVDFDFVSAPIGGSEGFGAELGAERNGWFYWVDRKYSGQSIKDAHDHLNINEAQWQAMVTDFRRTLDKFKVPEKEQDELIVIVGSTTKDIVKASPSAGH